MKKLGATLLACFLSILLTACENSAVPTGSASGPETGNGSAVTAPEVSTPEPQSVILQSSGSLSEQTDSNVRIYRDCTVTVLGYSLRMDSEGQPAVRVEYKFQNNSQMPASFSTTVIPNAYQNEESLSYTEPAEADPQYSALLTLTEPGESITCAGYFRLIDQTQPVTLEIKDLRDSSAGALCRMLDIADMTMETVSVS